MSGFEFQVIPVPKGMRNAGRGTRGQAKSCAAISQTLTEMANDGWEFFGTELLPEYKRHLLVFSRYEETSCLLFRRPVRAPLEKPAPPRKLEAVSGRRLTLQANADDHAAAVAEAQDEKRSTLRLENPVSIPGLAEHRRRTQRAPEPTEDIASIPRATKRKRPQTKGLSALERAVLMESQTV